MHYSTGLTKRQSFYRLPSLTIPPPSKRTRKMVISPLKLHRKLACLLLLWLPLKLRCPSAHFLLQSQKRMKIDRGGPLPSPNRVARVHATNVRYLSTSLVRWRILSENASTSKAWYHPTVYRVAVMRNQARHRAGLGVASVVTAQTTARLTSMRPQLLTTTT